jgi:hypothetical protein
VAVRRGGPALGFEALERASMNLVVELLLGPVRALALP